MLRVRSRVAADVCVELARQASHAIRAAHSKTGTDVVLEQVVEKLGAAGETVHTSRGYARNYLIPYGIAKQVPKTVVTSPPRSQAAGDAGAAGVAIKQKTTPTSQQQLGKVLNALATSPVELSRTTGHDSRLKQPVTAGCIAAAIMHQRKIALAPQLLVLDAPLAQAGQHTVPLRVLDAAGQRASLVVNIADTRSVAETLVGVASPGGASTISAAESVVTA